MRRRLGIECDAAKLNPGMRLEWRLTADDADFQLRRQPTTAQQPPHRQRLAQATGAPGTAGADCAGEPGQTLGVGDCISGDCAHRELRGRKPGQPGATALESHTTQRQVDEWQQQ